MNVVMGALVFWWSLDGQSVLRGGKTEQKRFSADCSVDRMNNVKPGCRPAADSAVFYAPPLGVSKLRSSQLVTELPCNVNAVQAGRRRRMRTSGARLQMSHPEKPYPGMRRGGGEGG